MDGIVQMLAKRQILSQNEEKEETVDQMTNQHQNSKPSVISTTDHYQSSVSVELHAREIPGIIVTNFKIDKLKFDEFHNNSKR